MALKRRLTLDVSGGFQGAKKRPMKSTKVGGGAPHPRNSRTPISSKSQKALTIDQANIALDTAGTVVLLDVVPQGTSDSDRIGLKWRDKAVHIRGQLVMSGSVAAPQTQVGTLYVVWDKQPNGALATVAQILDPGTSIFDGFYNLENQDRFKILHKKNFKMTKNTTTVGYNDSSLYMIDEYVKLPASCVACGTSGGTGIIGDRKSGALLMLATGDASSGALSNALNYSTRVYFEDV